LTVFNALVDGVFYVHAIISRFGEGVHHHASVLQDDSNLSGVLSEPPDLMDTATSKQVWAFLRR
jgi:hypothetical protein